MLERQNWRGQNLPNSLQITDLNEGCDQQENLTCMACNETELNVSTAIIYLNSQISIWDEIVSAKITALAAMAAKQFMWLFVSKHQNTQETTSAKAFKLLQGRLVMYLHKCVWRRKATKAKWQEDPASSIAAPVAVFSELFANLAINLISVMKHVKATDNDSLSELSLATFPLQAWHDCSMMK